MVRPHFCRLDLLIEVLRDCRMHPRPTVHELEEEPREHRIEFQKGRVAAPPAKQLQGYAGPNYRSEFQEGSLTARQDNPIQQNLDDGLAQLLEDRQVTDELLGV